MTQPIELELRRKAQTLEKAATLLEELGVRARDLELAAKAYRRAMVAAHEQGASFAEVGQAAGLSKSRVQQIINEERGNDGTE